MKLSKIPARLPTVNRQALKSPSAAVRKRGSSLMTIRERFFRDRPCCVMCDAEGVTRAATELDHIVPLWAGGRDNDGNRQGLCAEHHAAKSAEEAKLRAGADAPAV